jgi:hypothetical protein
MCRPGRTWKGEQDPVVLALDVEGPSDHFGAVDTHLQYDRIVLERASGAAPDPEQPPTVSIAVTTRSALRIGIVSPTSVGWTHWDGERFHAARQRPVFGQSRSFSLNLAGFLLLSRPGPYASTAGSPVPPPPPGQAARSPEG